jgi:chromosome segregation ATPase
MVFASAIAAAEDSIAENLRQIEDLKEKLSREEQARLSLQQAHDDLQTDHWQTGESFASVLQEKEGALKEKEMVFASAIAAAEDSIAKNLRQIENLQERLSREEQACHTWQQAHDALQASHLQSSTSFASALQEKVLELEMIRDQLTIAEDSAERKSDALSHMQQSAAHETEFLKTQINDQTATIDSLRQEVTLLYADYHDRVAKEKELEVAIQSLTAVAEQQDHALAEASSAFSMVQEYNHHLETENADLRHRLNSLETAERSTQRNVSDSQDEGYQVISPALMNLLKPK